MPRPRRRIRTLSRDIQADVEPGYNPNSTLTPVEDRKFRAIFEAAAKGLAPPSLQRPANQFEGQEETDLEATRETLDGLFEKLGQKAETPIEDERPQLFEPPATLPPLRELPPDLPQALQGAWRDVRRAMATHRSRDPSNRAEEKVLEDKVFSSNSSTVELERRNEDIEKMLEKFNNAKTDAEIWSAVESGIFPRVRVLIQVIKERVAASTKKHKKNQQESQHALRTATRKAQNEAAAALIQSTYPIHLLNALRALRTRFPRSPYSLALIPAVKKLDPVSQVLGLNTELYNELLYILWRHHSNVFECARTVEDMNTQGLIGDAHTSAIFLDAEREMQDSIDENADMSLTRRAWWQLGAVRDAMGQWHDAMDLLDARAEEERQYLDQWQADQSATEAGQMEVTSGSANTSLGQHTLQNNEIIAQASTTTG